MGTLLDSTSEITEQEKEVKIVELLLPCHLVKLIKCKRAISNKKAFCHGVATDNNLKHS